MTAVTAFFSQTNLSGRHGSIIIDHYKTVLRDFVEINDFPNAFPAEVHKCLGFHQQYPLPVNGAIPNERLLFKLGHINMIFLRQSVNDTKANVMFCFCVFPPWIAQTCDDKKFLSLFLIFKTVKKSHSSSPLISFPHDTKP